MEIANKVSHVNPTQECLFSCRMSVGREVHSKTEGKARRCNNASKDIKDLKDVLKRSVCQGWETEETGNSGSEYEGKSLCVYLYLMEQLLSLDYFVPKPFLLEIC